MRKVKPNQSERGITLVALIITVIILVILTAVAVKGITGNNGLIKQTEATAEDYTVKSYKEQIEQKANSIIVKYATLGEEITVYEIAEELAEESVWIKTAEATINSINNNDDILVTVVEGYTYQVYYNNTYGTLYVEYCRSKRAEEQYQI